MTMKESVKVPLAKARAKFVNLSRTAKSTIAVVSVLTVGGTALAVQQTATTGANEVPPIYTQVEDHEQRIGGLEGRQDATEAKVEQNTTDIQVIQQTTGAPTSSPVSSTPTETTPEPIPTPVPTPESFPEPKKDPRTITAVVDTIMSNGLRSCDYTLLDPNFDAKQGTIRQNADVPCKAVGSVLY